MFYLDQNQPCLLLGRLEKKKEDKESKDSDSDKSVKHNHPADADDDSPYWVRIVLDEQFLSYLEEPNVLTP